MILNRLLPIIDEKLIPKQVGFRPGWSCKGQILKLTQHTEDGFEKGMLTGAIFVDLSATYDPINHRKLLHKFLEITKYQPLTKFTETMLSNWRFFVILNGKRSKWRNQKNGLPDGSVPAPLLIAIYTNDQPLPENTQRFLYADDLCIATQNKSFEMVEQHLRKALLMLSFYYQNNWLKSNMEKTQSCLFYLRNHHATRKMNIIWNGTPISHDKYLVYLGVTINKTLSFKEHTRKLKAKIQSRNALLSKLTNSKWGANPYTLRTTALALCFSTAEYACPGWERSAHAGKVDSLNDTYRRITDRLKPIPLNKVYSLAEIASLNIHREVSSQYKRQKCDLDQRHPMYGLTAAPSRLKYRKFFKNCSSSRQRHHAPTQNTEPVAELHGQYSR